MAVWGGLTNSCKRREAKSKGEKEGYKYLNAEFQRIARNGKKAFLSNQCKEIEENSRMETLEISSRKLVIPREHFNSKMDTIKDRNVIDPTEAEDINKRWQ